MNTAQLSMRLGFPYTLTAMWFIQALGITPAAITDTEYLWSEEQLPAIRDAIVLRLQRGIDK